MPFKLKYNKSGFPFKQTEEDVNPYDTQKVQKTGTAAMWGTLAAGPLGGIVLGVKKFREKQRAKAFNQGYEDGGYDAMEPL